MRTDPLFLVMAARVAFGIGDMNHQLMGLSRLRHAHVSLV